MRVVIEPLRIMHSRCMAIANKKSSSNRPALLDEVDPSRSMTIKVLQYYSSLLAGQCSRLRLVWGWQQCSDLLAWMRQCPEWARELRRLILSAACLVLRRFEKYTSKFPWRLYSLADARLGEGVRSKIIDEFFASAACCKPPGLA